MVVNESTGDKMKKVFKRIWDGPIDDAEGSLQSPEGVLQTAGSKSLFSSINNFEINDIPRATTSEFSNMLKANLLKFKPATDAEKDDTVNSFVPYNVGRKDESAMITDAAIDNTTNIFSAPKTSADNGVTTISRGTSIVGELHSDSDIEILGSFKGNIITKGNVNICGKVVGDIKGANIELTSCSVQGNITATGMLTIDSDSVLVGDTKSENLSIDGKLKGNAQTRNMITCQSEALILGNVSAAVASISEGAKLQGSIQIVNGQIAEIRISEDEIFGGNAKTTSPIPPIDLDK